MRWLILFAIVSCSAFGMTINKTVEGTMVAGEPLKVVLEITDPVPGNAQIQSKDIIAGSGYDIECYELQLPDQPMAVIEMSEFAAYTPGDFTLPPTKITYYEANGSQVTIESNEVNLTITEPAQPLASQTQQVTQVYQCNGMSMQSTQTSTTSQQSQQQQESQQNQQSQQQQEAQQDQIDNKLSKNNMNQDMKNLKKEMSQELADQQQMEKEFQENLEQQMQEQMQELAEQGYDPVSKDVQPTSNNSGDFDYEFQNQDGSKASLSGSMENGELSTQLQSAEEEQRLKDILQNSSQYQDLASQLEGYNMTNFTYSSMQNMSTTTSEFTDQNGNKVNITAKIENDEVVEANLERERKIPWFWIFSLLALALAMYYFMRNKEGEEALEEPFDHAAQAQQMITEALALFGKKEYKEAYGRASEALRLYYSYELGDGRWITASETLRLLKSKKKPYKDAQKCLSLCGLVEFARYKPNKKDFSDIIDLATKAISGRS